jgi:hypothetical protein
VRFRVIGVDLAATGTDDAHLLPVLHRLPQPTFFSLDHDFHRPDWAHAGYCLVWLDVRGRQAAEFIRRFLRHPEFDTQARRMGTVIRVHADGLWRWQIGRRTSQSFPWHDE